MAMMPNTQVKPSNGRRTIMPFTPALQENNITHKICHNSITHVEKLFQMASVSENWPATFDDQTVPDRLAAHPGKELNRLKT